MKNQEKFSDFQCSARLRREPKADGAFWNEQKTKIFIEEYNLKHVIRTHRILMAVKLLCMIP